MEWIWIVGVTWCVLALPLAVATGYFIRRVDAKDADRRTTVPRPSPGSRRGVRESSLRLLAEGRDDRYGPPAPPDSRRGGEPELSLARPRRIGRRRIGHLRLHRRP